MSQNDIRILLVDDFEMVRAMMRSSLKDLGYSKIDEARNGEEAMELLTHAIKEQMPYSLLFVDWNMPVLDGLEVVRRCRADATLKDLPIIMVTAEAETSAITTALSAGATDYVIKPIGADILERKLRRILTRAGY